MISVARTLSSRARVVILSCIVAFATSTILADLALAQTNYPTRPVRFLVPFAPGGQASLLARLIGQKLTESWGQPVIVDNRAGGGSIIGTDALAKATPDGYTLILTTNTHVILPHLHANLPFDVLKDFAAVASVGSNETIMLAHPTVGANTLQELIAIAKAHPGKLTYSSSGLGGIQNVASEMFNLAAGVSIRAIFYKGAGPAVADLVGGHVQTSIQGTATSLPHIKSGKLRGLAITGTTRWSALPNVPTFAEAGVPAYDIKYWQAVLAPAGTPHAIIDRLAREINRILATSEMRERMTSQGLDPWILTPTQFVAAMKADLAKYGKTIKAANIRLDQ